MKVLFTTNIDNYKKSCFPQMLTTPPRVGEKVSVTDTFKSYYRDEKLPTTLEVVDVIWHDDYVVCELWYRKIDIDIAKSTNKNLF